MSNFFTNKKDYESRLDICRACPMLFKPTMSCKRCGCFMRVKAKISSMSCPDKKWLPINSTGLSTEVPQELVQQCIDMMPMLKGGKARSQAVKREMIELYNAIYSASFNPNTSCGSCVSTCYSGIKEIADKNM